MEWFDIQRRFILLELHFFLAKAVAMAFSKGHKYSDQYSRGSVEVVPLFLALKCKTLEDYVVCIEVDNSIWCMQNVPKDRCLKTICINRTLNILS